MLNINIHKATLITILRSIYTDSLLRNLLGFKGGTAAMLFYGLPRFSVDLDFDLLHSDSKEAVLSRLKKLLPQFGVVQEGIEKHYTLFFLLSYKKEERGLKIEISKRLTEAHFELKNYLGISMLVMKQEDMFACKLAALLTRARFASRDLFDLWYFFDNHWPISGEVVKAQTNLFLPEALKKAESKVMSLKAADLLSGLGELVDNKQKTWVKEKLREELLFKIKLYRSQM